MTRYLLLLLLLAYSATSIAKPEKIIISDDLEIVQVSKNVLIHVSYLQTKDFGKVGCNGMIYINNNEAVIMDTPPDDSGSARLLNWFAATYPNVQIKFVIVEHFHEDCLGGLAEFHRRNIPSYSNKLTAELAKTENVVTPQKTFETAIMFAVGKGGVMAYYPGEAHTKDNIVVWIKDEKILFGGCMIKALGAGKGNLADANEAEWSNSVRKVKDLFPTVKKVVPGHGDYGGKKLLNYTIELFSKN